MQLSQIPDFGRDFHGPTAGKVLGAAVGQQLGSTASELIRRGMSIAPTLQIRPGNPFNVMATQDIVFPGPYETRGSHDPDREPRGQCQARPGAEASVSRGSCASALHLSRPRPKL